MNTPHRHIRARVGKDDAIDAEAAARKVLSGEATAVVKDTTQAIEPSGCCGWPGTLR